MKLLAAILLFVTLLLDAGSVAAQRGRSSGGFTSSTGVTGRPAWTGALGFNGSRTFVPHGVPGFARSDGIFTTPSLYGDRGRFGFFGVAPFYRGPNWFSWRHPNVAIYTSPYYYGSPYYIPSLTAPFASGGGW